MRNTDLTNLMNAYDSMATFPDVNEGFQQMVAVPNMTVVAFTNGTHLKISITILRSKDLAIHTRSIPDIISIDQLVQFKPSSAVDRVGESKALKDILFGWSSQMLSMSQEL